VPRAPREQATWPRVFARSSLRPWGLEPAVRRRVRPIEPFTPPSSSDPARKRFREAPARRSPVPSEAAWETCVSSARLVDETCCPRPLSAAPRASHVLLPLTAARGCSAGPRRRFGSFGLLVDRPLARSAISFEVLPLVESARGYELRQRTA